MELAQCHRLFGTTTTISVSGFFFKKKQNCVQLPKRHSSEATPLLPELALFFSVLAMRGLERFWLQDRLIELSCGNGLVHATCNRAMRDVHFAEYALSVGDDEWRAYCQFRGTEGSAEIRDSFRVIAMVVSSAPKVDHWLWTMLPTSTRCPFAFNCDAPFILDIDRFVDLQCACWSDAWLGRTDSTCARMATLVFGIGKYFWRCRRCLADFVRHLCTFNSVLSL